MVAAKYEQAKASPSLLRVFWNTVLGLPFAEASEAPDWRRLYDRRERYPIGTVPPGVRFLTCGVDVQKDRLEAHIVGFGRGKESWSVDYRVLPGDPVRPEVWTLLDALLAEDIPCTGGGTLPIRMLCVDSGYATQSVYGWVRQYPQPLWGPAGVAARAPRTVSATKGVEYWRAVLLPPAKVDTSATRKGLKVARIGTSLVKRELYDWLRLEGPTAEDAAQGLGHPPGFVHFPEYAEDFFKGLTAEQLITHKTRGGFVRLDWEAIPGRVNDPLDCRVYARAAAAVLGLDRFQESDWATLERAVGQVPAPPTPTTAAPPTRSAPAVAAVPRRPWIAPRRGWIR